jgi:hypothetical protein
LIFFVNNYEKLDSLLTDSNIFSYILFVLIVSQHNNFLELQYERNKWFHPIIMKQLLYATPCECD